MGGADGGGGVIIETAGPRFRSKRDGSAQHRLQKKKKKGVGVSLTMKIYGSEVRA
jgi:hypothetical protein